MENIKNPIYDLESQDYNLKLAEALKKIPEFKKPAWIEFVKSGSGKSRPIDDEDFWYKRAASILRQVYKRKIVGVNRLKNRYGSKKERGARPEKFRKSGGKIIRSILQQSDKAEFTEIAKDIKGVRSKRPGRQITEKGKKFMESIK
ncbi:MAG: 40S ribosomal protein S19 [Candidatus Pacearchaeota archaeon]